MKKDLVAHVLILLGYVGLVVLVRKWITVPYIPFLYGAVLGTILPDIDHILYVYAINPNQAQSEKLSALIAQSKIREVWKLLLGTRTERKNLIFHTATFQLVFLIFVLFIVTSSGSLLGRGLALAFALHLLVDEVMDYLETKNLDNWFVGFPFKFDEEYKKFFVIGNGILLLLFGLVL